MVNGAMSRKVIRYFIGIFISVCFPAFGGVVFEHLPQADYIGKLVRQTIFGKSIRELSVNRRPDFLGKAREVVSGGAQEFADDPSKRHNAVPFDTAPAGTLAMTPDQTRPVENIASQTDNTKFTPLDQFSYDPAVKQWVITRAVLTPHGHRVVTLRFLDLKSVLLLRMVEDEIACQVGCAVPIMRMVEDKIAYRVGCGVPHNAGDQAGH